MAKGGVGRQNKMPKFLGNIYKYIFVKNPENEFAPKSKMVSAHRRNQDRSCYSPHQNRRERERRMRRKRELVDE